MTARSNTSKFSGRSEKAPAGSPHNPPAGATFSEDFKNTLLLIAIIALPVACSVLKVGS
jgi:hypothetical protein